MTIIPHPTPTWVGSGLKLRPIDADRLDVAHLPALVLQHIAHLLQLLSYPPGQRRIAVEVDGVLGQQLMVHALRRHRLVQRHAVVVQVVHHLEDRGEDPRATRGTDNQLDLAIAGHQAGAHRRQHALARFDRVGITADHAKGVRRPRLGAEVIHLVVEQETGTLHHDATAVVEVEGVGIADRVALLVDDREMRGLVRFKARLDFVGCGNGLRVDLGCAVGQVILGHQLVHRHLGEGRVAQVVGAVGEHPLLDLGQQVDVLRRVMRHPFEVGRAVFLDAQQLGQCHTA